MAVTLTAAALAEAAGQPQATAERLLPVVAELVERYAPAAPEAVANEAAVRCAGYLAETPPDARRSETTGAVSTSWAATHTSALRHSGAMSLLSPYKVRRAGAVG